MRDITPISEPISEESSDSGLVLPSKAYDILKLIVLIFLPGISAFYFALANIWALPYAEQVVGTIAALTALLGLGLKLSSNAYDNSDARFDGTLAVSENDTSQIHQIEISTPPEDLKTQKSVTFKVLKITGE